MPLTADTRYADWKAPAEDARLLLWPEPEALLVDAEQNLRRLNSTQSVSIQGVPLAELRRSLREWVGHRDNDRPLVAMGHQAELYHAGVWAKNALIDTVAAKLGGEAYQFAVDSDEPKHLKLKWPGGSVPLSDHETPAEWSGLLPAPSPAHLAQVAQTFEHASAGWDFRPLVPEFLASLRRQSLESPSLPVSLTNAMHALDWSLGLRHHAMLISPLCASQPYLLFAWHVLSRAGAFASDYNAALEEFRREHKIRTSGRPMPNLKVSDDECEVPFWLDALSTGTRTRAVVIRRRDLWVLRGPTGPELALPSGEPSASAASQLQAWLLENDLRLSPRALTLTMVLRLLLVDQFVHGIGGGRYDQVTDRLLRRQFGIEPPRFAVTTATLYFPQTVGRARVCMGCVLQDGHRLRHGVLGEEKTRLVEAIAAAPRRSLQRSTLFHEMHGRLAAAADHPDLHQWELELSNATRREREEMDLFDRELFYAIQPRDRLEVLLGQYRSRFAR